MIDCFSLLRKHFPHRRAYEIVAGHSIKVAEKGVRVAGRLGLPLPEIEFVREACLLHDIGVSATDSPGLGCSGSWPYIRHGILGREILEKEGLLRHALVCERHIGVGITAEQVLRDRLPLPPRDMVPVSLPEKIVCYADLFYSKKGKSPEREKEPEEIRSVLSSFGADKAAVFDGWLEQFGL